jgi:hypothetical protein
MIYDTIFDVSGSTAGAAYAWIQITTLTGFSLLIRCRLHKWPKLIQFLVVVRVKAG